MNIINFLCQSSDLVDGGEMPRMKKPMAKPLPEPVLFTPSMAKDILDNHAAPNRTIIRGNEHRLAADINDGTFMCCIDPVAFNKKGELVNGQHRLKAIADTGVPVWLYVFVDVPDDAVLDILKARTINEDLVIRGLIEPDLGSKMPMAVTKRYLRSKYGRQGTREGGLTNAQIAAFENKYANEIRAAVAVSQKGSGSPIANKAPVQAGTLAAIILGTSIDDLYRFFTCVNTGFISSDKERAAIVLRNFLVEHKGKSGGTDADLMVSTTETAIHDFINETPRTRRYTSPEHVYMNQL